MKKVLIVAIVSLLLLAGCRNSDSPADTGGDGEVGANDTDLSDLFVTVSTGGISGVYYPIGGAIANVLETELGIDASVQATGASVENINLLNTGRAELAITMADAVFQAYEGSGAFEGQEPVESLRGLMSMYPNLVQVVTTEETGIESIHDLRGRSVGVGAANSGVELNARMVLEAHGMTYDDIHADYLSYSEAIDQIKNGFIDAAFITSGIPNATIMDLDSTHNAKILPIDDEALNYLKETYSFFTSDVIPADAYNTDENIQTAAITNVLLISSQISEEAAYEITKALFDNLEQIQNSHNSAANISLDTVDVGMPVPFHPGVKRYYKEVGVLD